MVTPPKPPSDARAQISQSTVVIPKALLASLPPPTTAEMMFDLEEVDKDGGFGLPEFEEGYIFHQTGITSRTSLSSRRTHRISPSAYPQILAANHLAHTTGRLPAQPDTELSSELHEELLLGTARGMFGHELFRQCAVCGKEGVEAAYVSSIVCDYTIKPYIVDQWSPLCEEEGPCFESLDAKEVEVREEVARVAKEKS